MKRDWCIKQDLHQVVKEWIGCPADDGNQPPSQDFIVPESETPDIVPHDVDEDPLEVMITAGDTFESRLAMIKGLLIGRIPEGYVPSTKEMDALRPLDVIMVWEYLHERSYGGNIAMYNLGPLTYVLTRLDEVYGPDLPVTGAFDGYDGKFPPGDVEKLCEIEDVSKLGVLEDWIGCSAFKQRIKDLETHLDDYIPNVTQLRDVSKAEFLNKWNAVLKNFREAFDWNNLELETAYLILELRAFPVNAGSFTGKEPKKEFSPDFKLKFCGDIFVENVKKWIGCDPPIIAASESDPSGGGGKGLLGWFGFI